MDIRVSLDGGNGGAQTRGPAPDDEDVVCWDVHVEKSDSVAVRAGTGVPGSARL
jgi:hypothetical protein